MGWGLGGVTGGGASGGTGGVAGAGMTASFHDQSPQWSGLWMSDNTANRRNERLLSQYADIQKNIHISY